MNDHRLEVSVVLPTRDRWELAAVALRSALGQQGVKLEICVVDDGSATPAPHKFGDDQRVRMFRHDRARGVAVSRNRAIREARGEWVAFLDDDDVWAPWHLERLLRAVQGGGPRWAFSGYVMTTLRRAPIGNGPVPAVEANVVRQFLRINPVGTPSCALVAADTLRSVGGFDERMSLMADWDLWVRLAMVGRPAVSAGFTVGYAQHGGNMSLDMDRARAEWAYMAARYRAELERFDFVFADNEYFWRWLAFGYARRGPRRLAARFFLKAAASGGGTRDVVRAIGIAPIVGWPVRIRRWLLVAFARRARSRRAPISDHPWLQSFGDRASPAGSGSVHPVDRIVQRFRVRTRPSP